MSAIQNCYRRIRRGASFAGRLLLRWSSNSQVMSGPFAGLRYGAASGGSVYAAKILGTYELELAPVMAGWPTVGFTRIIDVGAAEGFYAVGLAKWLGIPVTAFEIEPASRTLLEGMAKLNDVTSRVEVCGACDSTALSECLDAARGQPQLLICDVEGFELELLDPVKVPSLTDTWILVETHDCFRPNCTQELMDRFGPSHRVERVRTRPRTATDFPCVGNALRHLPQSLKVRLMKEGRPGPMDWLWMMPKRRSTPLQSGIASGPAPRP